MLQTLAKIIDAGGPLHVKYCTNTGLWVILHSGMRASEAGNIVIETYNSHDKAEDECVRLNNLIVARNVVEAIRELPEGEIALNGLDAVIDVILAENVK